MSELKKVPEELVPVVTQVKCLSPSSLGIFPFPEQSLKSLCVPHTRHRYVPGRCTPKIILFFSYQVSAHPECEVTSQLFVLSMLYYLIFNAVLKTEVMSDACHNLYPMRRCN